jgi:hypothetical protein
LVCSFPAVTHVHPVAVDETSINNVLSPQQAHLPVKSIAQDSVDVSCSRLLTVLFNSQMQLYFLCVLEAAL